MSAKQGYVQTDDGVRLFFNAVGSGATVLLVPNGLFLSPEFDRLAAGRTIVYYDPRNRGRSDTIDDPAKLANVLYREAEDMEAVRRHVGAERVDLIGHSYAGIVVALYAMKHPSHVRRLVQIGPGAFTFGRPYPPELNYADAVTSEVFTKLGHTQQAGNADPVAACRAAWTHLPRLYVFDQTRADQLARWGFCDLPNERNALSHFNQHIVPSWRALKLETADFARASMPTLVIHGRQDRNAPYGGGRDWAAALPDARLLSIDRAAHAPWIDAPEAVFDAIALFLGGAWPTDAVKVQRP